MVIHHEFSSNKFIIQTHFFASNKKIWIPSNSIQFIENPGIFPDFASRRCVQAPNVSVPCAPGHGVLSALPVAPHRRHGHLCGPCRGLQGREVWRFDVLCREPTYYQEDSPTKLPIWKKYSPSFGVLYTIPPLQGTNIDQHTPPFYGSWEDDFPLPLGWDMLGCQESIWWWDCPWSTNFATAFSEKIPALCSLCFA